MSRVLSAAEYCVVERPQLSWLIPSYVPLPGLVLLLGEPKAGKSFLALQIALAVASGTRFLQQAISPASVLYLQFDTSELVWRLRLKDLQASMTIPLPPRLFFLHPDDQPSRCNILTLESQQILKSAIVACDPKLIIVDVLRECHNADEQDSTQMKIVGDVLMTLSHGRTLLLIHHARKMYENQGPPRVVDIARGSSYISGKADALWLLHRGELKIVSRFHPDETHHVERLPSGLWQIN
jgi:RecA-family ATPase